MSSLKVDSNGLVSLSEKLDEIISLMEDTFSQQDVIFDRITDENLWYGPSQISCFSKYKEMSNQYQGIIENLRQRSEFMKNVATLYADADAQADKIASNDF